MTVTEQEQDSPHSEDGGQEEGWCHQSKEYRVQHAGISPTTDAQSNGSRYNCRVLCKQREENEQETSSFDRLHVPSPDDEHHQYRQNESVPSDQRPREYWDGIRVASGSNAVVGGGVTKLSVSSTATNGPNKKRYSSHVTHENNVENFLFLVCEL